MTSSVVDEALVPVDVCVDDQFLPVRLPVDEDMTVHGLIENSQWAHVA